MKWKQDDTGQCERIMSLTHNRCRCMSWKSICDSSSYSIHVFHCSCRFAVFLLFSSMYAYLLYLWNLNIFFIINNRVILVHIFHVYHWVHHFRFGTHIEANECLYWQGWNLHSQLDVQHIIVICGCKLVTAGAGYSQSSPVLEHFGFPIKYGCTWERVDNSGVGESLILRGTQLNNLNTKVFMPTVYYLSAMLWWIRISNVITHLRRSSECVYNQNEAKTASASIIKSGPLSLFIDLTQAFRNSIFWGKS